MGWSKYGVLAMLLVVIMTLGAFGAHFGYTVDGVPAGSAIRGEDEIAQPNLIPGLPGLLRTLKQDADINMPYDMTMFLLNMAFFQIDGMPPIMSMAFDIILFMVFFLVASLFRGTN